MRLIPEYLAEIDERQREEAIRIAKTHPGRSDWRAAERLDSLLIALGDPETITKALSKFWASKQGLGLGRALAATH